MFEYPLGSLNASYMSKDKGFLITIPEMTSEIVSDHCFGRIVGFLGTNVVDTEAAVLSPH